MRLRELSMRFVAILLVLIVGQLASPSLRAQQAPAAAPKNWSSMAASRQPRQRQNLWQGVDSAGFLTGERGQVPVLTLRGEISDTVMPISVGATDMNADGLVDLVTMDVLGYLRIYFNSGDKQQPKFTSGDLGGVFLTRTAQNDPTIGREAPGARLAPRIFPTEMMKSGKGLGSPAIILARSSLFRTADRPKCRISSNHRTFPEPSSRR